MLEIQLAQLPKAKRIKYKSAREYRNQAVIVTVRWPDIRAICSQAKVFHEEVIAATVDESLGTS